MVYSGQGDRHWTAAAEAVVQALVLLALTLKAEDRNLVTVRKLLMLTSPDVSEQGQRGGRKEMALLTMMESLVDKFDGVVAGQGNALKAMAEKERAVLSEARTQTRWLDSPAGTEDAKLRK